MEVKEVLGGGYLFKKGDNKKTHFRCQIGDLSALYGNAKWEKSCRVNERKIRKVLSKNELNEFRLLLKSGDIEIGEPILTLERNAEDIKKGCRPQFGCEIKSEASRVDVEITLPPGGAITVFSIKDAFESYIYNDGGKFHLTSDVKNVEEATGIYF